MLLAGSRLPIGYFAAALLPLLYSGIPNPVAVRWYWTHGNAPMSPEIEKKGVAVGNAMPFIAQIVLLFILWMLIRHSGIRMPRK